VSEISGKGSSVYVDGDFAEICPEDLVVRLQETRALQLLDVREKAEWNEAHIEAARLVPIYTLEETLEDLDPDQETIVYCARGVRGRAAALYLSVCAGFRCVRNLAGGIARWELEGKPTVPAREVGEAGSP
jgi:rhodanese-related sulfurtransferase